MKVKILIIAVFLISGLQIQAQLKLTKVKILLNNGEEKFGFGKRNKSDVYLYQQRKKSKEKEIIPIATIKIISYVFKEGYREFHYLKDIKRGKYKLLIPLIKGKVKLYKSFGRENMSEINNNIDVSYKVSKDGVNYVTFKNFRKEAMKFFGDCNLIVDKVKSRDFFRTDLAEMVIIYNNDCTENQKSFFKLKDLNDKKPIIMQEHEIELSKIVPSKLIENKTVKIIEEKVLVDLKPIYFDLDKATLTKESLLELDKVVKLMKEFDKINIEVDSHTDSRGLKSYNLDLSSKRAVEVINYLINKGINKERLIARGFGESRPINKCIDSVKCSELEYEQNRRTEFVIANPKMLKN